jgi:hypothetical protein
MYVYRVRRLSPRITARFRGRRRRDVACARRRIVGVRPDMLAGELTANEVVIGLMSVTLER